MKAVMMVAFLFWQPAKFLADLWPQDMPASTLRWFKAQRSPHGVPCCDVADGHPTDWVATPEGYYVPIDGKWTEVPKEAVIIGAGNPTGRGVVWFVRQGAGSVYIRCFIPGPESELRE